MAKYIDKDKAYRIVLHYGSYVASSKIAEMESIEIVRCGECKHRVKNEYCGTYDPEYYCKLDTDDIDELGRNAEDPNWFCADGERKEAEHE